MKHGVLNKMWTINQMWEASKNAKGADIALHYHNLPKEEAIKLADLASELIGVKREDREGSGHEWFFVEDGNFKVTFFVKRQPLIGNLRDLDKVLEEIK